jgi:hypothetical protein
LLLDVPDAKYNVAELAWDRIGRRNVELNVQHDQLLDCQISVNSLSLWAFVYCDTKISMFNNFIMKKMGTLELLKKNDRLHLIIFFRNEVK